MARMRWTEEKLAELRRRMNLEETYAEIGAALGCTETAAKQKAHRKGWASPGRSGFLTWRRLKGTKRSASFKRKISKAQKRNWQKPEHRARMIDATTAANRRPERCAKVAAAHDRRRGFAIPADLKPEYIRLQHNKGFDAREAGRILGLIPQPATEKLNGTCSA